ncbi:histidinol dehydrogenase [Verrucomicrobiota bacterium]|nr:histidinol dehydrogenase [Verrucomicrobiota bacterium]
MRYESVSTLKDMAIDELSFFGTPEAGAGKAEYKGESEVNGTKVQSVENSYRSGFKVLRHFDARISTSSPPTWSGPAARCSARSSTTSPGSRAWPSPRRKPSSFDGKKVRQVEYTQVVVNHEVPDAAFAFPSAKPMPVLRASDKDFTVRLRAFIGNGEAAPDIRSAVAAIVADVKQRGDAAVLYHTAKFDHAKLNVRQLRVPLAQIEQAAARLDPAKRKAFEEAARCIEDFHRRTLPKGWTAKNPHGATVGERYHAIRRCGLYIPGGQVPLVSTALMTALRRKSPASPTSAPAPRPPRTAR